MCMSQPSAHFTMTIKRESIRKASNTLALNWATTDINAERSLGPVNWEALQEYAINVKRKHAANHDVQTTCQLSSEYNMGGLNLVRRLDFQDGTSWIARIQLHKSASTGRLVREIDTMAVVRERSNISVPEVFAYEADCNNAVGAPFMIMEFIPGDTAMDSFGGHRVHKGKTPPQFKAKFHAEMADIQVQIASIRFPKIGSIIKRSDGTYSVGPLPGIGGPFDSAAEFFEAWANQAKYPYHEGMIRERTPPDVVDEILRSIQNFPSRLKDFSKQFHFREGPYPLFHTDFYNSNIIVNSNHDVLSVIDWENAIVAPWEIVEFAKDLSIVPPAMDGSFYCENEATCQMMAERRNYVELVRKAEEARQFDGNLSTTLGDSDVQNLAHAIWLYEDGRIGFYTKVLEAFEERQGC